MNLYGSGRPALDTGRPRKIISVSMTSDLQIKFRRLGGSKWLREQIERATNESANRTPLAGKSDVSMGQPPVSG